MQFKVPQFLDIEDKIFGPFTFQQFVYLAGGAGMCFILYRLLGLVLGSIPIAIIAGLALALAFYRPNGKPFIFMLESWFKFMLKNKLYIWQKDRAEKNDSQNKSTKAIAPVLNAEKLTGQRLKDLAWSLDVLDLNKNKGN